MICEFLGDRMGLCDHGMLGPAYTGGEKWLCTFLSDLMFSNVFVAWNLPSVQFICSVVSDSFQPHGLATSPWRTRLPCPSPTPRACWNSRPSSRWYAIQPSLPPSSPSPPAFNLSHRQGLFQWVRSSHQVAKVLELQLQHQSFQWIFTVDFL